MAMQAKEFTKTGKMLMLKLGQMASTLLYRERIKE